MVRKSAIKVWERYTMTWEDQYKESGKLWGEEPSMLAAEAVKYLQAKAGTTAVSILDIGCGYGRDALYLSGNLNCKILGIDVSEKAIKIASNTAVQLKNSNMKFHCLDFSDLTRDGFDIVFVSNVYQILQQREREKLRHAISRALRQGGLLFLSTLSIKDPEHFGKGSAIPGEANSFRDKVYLHFCTREELEKDFNFLQVQSLYEHEYYEPRITGETHHHVSWVFIGKHTP